ncbi:hypothetical protein CBS101457_006567 [Exobasidium rhododendri]|nr:hypothetical protein CBS101457_006567 [Exobasidium rhododendri]
MSSLGKRHGEEIERPNKRIRQREQKRVAHQIPTQTPGLIAAGSTSSSGATRSEKIIKLPNQLLVENAVSSYSYEIKSLRNAIKSASAGKSIRAWQMLPRHKRRRNASHNLLALPKRLRDKGGSELRASKTSPRSRSETRKRKGKGDRSALGAYPRRKESARRQELVQRATRAAIEGKAWMETHLWHTKRFRMSSKEGKVVGGTHIPLPDRWGYSLAEESSMKSYRSTWRDEKRAASIMDVSYDAWIRLGASMRAAEDRNKVVEALSTVLQRAGLRDGWQEEWREGRMCCRTLLTAPVKGYKANSTEVPLADYLRCCGPVQIIWVKPAEADILNTTSRKRQEILLRTHPAAASSLERCLHMAVTALSRTLSFSIEIRRLNSLPHPLVSAGSRSAGRVHGKGDGESRMKSEVLNEYSACIQEKRRRGEAYNIFELSGPSSKALLAKVLRPINDEDSNKMASIRTGALSDGIVIPLNVHDPRLSFPPRMASSKDGGDEKSLHLSHNWSPHSRLLTKGYTFPAFRKGEIDRRKSKLVTPGSRLLPTSKDDIIPVVVIARNQQQTKNELSFTLLVPRGWGQAFWLSLVHPGTRVLGQVQSLALNFDKGRALFPMNWVGTPGYESQEQTDSLIALGEWKRKPPSKRCNFDSFGARWPFGGTGLWREIIGHGMQLSSLVESVDPSAEMAAPWTFAVANEASLDGLVRDYQAWRGKSTCEDATTPLPLLKVKSAVVCVKLTACRKGSFARWDEIHHLKKEEREMWKVALQSVQCDRHSKAILQKLESQQSLSAESHIGSVTTSNFSLSNGKVSALASISLLAYLDIVSMDGVAEATTSTKRERNPIPLHALVVVKDIQGGLCRAASLTVVSLV